MMSFESTPIQTPFDRGTEGDAPSNVLRLVHDVKNNRFVRREDLESADGLTELHADTPFYVDWVSRIFDAGKSLIGHNRNYNFSDETVIDAAISDYLDKKRQADPDFQAKWSGISTLAE